MAIMLVVSIISCIGTWIAPQLIAVVSSSPTTINDPHVQDPAFYTIVSIGWVVLVVVGSVSVWTIAIISIRMIGGVFQFEDWRDLFPNQQFSRLAVVTTLIYLLIAVYISTLRFLPLPSAIIVIGLQTAGMILVGGLAVFITYLSYWMYSSVITQNLEKLSIEKPEVISSLSTKDDIALAILELQKSYIKIGLKSLLSGLAIGAVLGGYLAMFGP